MTTPSDVLSVTGMITAHCGLMDLKGSDRLHLPHTGGAEPHALPRRDAEQNILTGKVTRRDHGRPGEVAGGAP